MLKKYQTPDFWDSKNPYKKWLGQKASQHLGRDRKKCNITETHKDYKEAIDKAVFRCKGKDFYTGDEMSWDLVGEYNNIKIGKLPTIDHVYDVRDGKKIKFEICSWQTNDAKNDLSLDEFKVLCKKVLEHN